MAAESSWPVTITMGTFVKRASSRRRRQTVRPSVPGMSTSSRTSVGTLRECSCERVGAVIEGERLQADFGGGFGEQQAAEVFVIGDDD